MHFVSSVPLNSEKFRLNFPFLLCHQLREETSSITIISIHIMPPIIYYAHQNIVNLTDTF